MAVDQPISESFPRDNPAVRLPAIGSIVLDPPSPLLLSFSRALGKFKFPQFSPTFSKQPKTTGLAFQPGFDFAFGPFPSDHSSHLQQRNNNLQKVAERREQWREKGEVHVQGAEP